jgi:hypothetical protein
MGAVFQPSLIGVCAAAKPLFLQAIAVLGVQFARGLVESQENERLP